MLAVADLSTIFTHFNVCFCLNYFLQRRKLQKQSQHPEFIASIMIAEG